MIVSLLVPMIIMVLQFGMALNYKNQAQHLAGEGARLAAVDRNPGGGTLQEYLKGQAVGVELTEGGTDAVDTPLSICIDTPSGAVVGNPVVVEATLAYNWLPILGEFVSVTTTDITGSATMRLEKVPSNYSSGCST